MSTIFVQIASYKDPQLIPTLKDLIEKSKSPHNLKITVCWQHDDDESLEIFLDSGFDVESFDDSGEFDVIKIQYNSSSIQLIDVHYTKTKGACWARNKIQQYYNNETYTLQLDSHHRFVKNWDHLLIDMIEKLRYKSKKPLITAYIPSFNPEKDPEGRVNIPWKMNFDRFIPEGAVFFLPASFESNQKHEEPIHARFYSAHFAFADGSFAVEVQHDPEYFFHGEEISIAARAFTHGYDLYHPHIVVAWHEYTRKGRTKVWDDHTTTAKKKGQIELDWVERNNICHRRNRILFGMDGEDPSQIDFGKYGFGTVRSLREYEFYSGLSFKHRAVQQCVIDKVDPTLDYYRGYTDEEWAQTLTKSHDVHILVHKTELPKDITDYDFWYVGCHDENDVEIYRKDMVPSEIKKYTNQEWVDSRLIFLDNRIPKKYTVWPHSKSQGWCKKLTYDIKP